MIYEKRDIVAVKELFYDYKFEAEFDECAPCNFGTRVYRGFVNWNKELKKIDTKLPDGKSPSVKSISGVKY